MVTSQYLVCYDIVENNIRTQVSELCKDAGLERIQYSVFFGSLTPDRFRALQMDTKNTIKDQNANIHFVSICGSCETKHRILTSVNVIAEEVENIDMVEDTYEHISEFDMEVLII